LDARGTFLAAGADGQFFPSFSVAAISPTDGSTQASGTFLFTGINDRMDTPFFDPGGQLVYASLQLTGLHIFSLSVSSSTIQFTELPSSPLPSSISPLPLSALPNPGAEFTYIGGSNLITTYPIDTITVK
jgi:hypothetical protein